jgi:hypothetical protein
VRLRDRGLRPVAGPKTDRNEAKPKRGAQAPFRIFVNPDVGLVELIGIETDDLLNAIRGPRIHRAHQTEGVSDTPSLKRITHIRLEPVEGLF